jgi:hypothetical protein
VSGCPYDLRDYLLEELSPAARAEVERYLEASTEARAELEALRTTQAALLCVPEEEVPRRIAFVSDKVFEPSPWKRLWRDVQEMAPRFAFGMAAVLIVLFAGIWWTQPTLTIDGGGWRLAFESPSPAVTTDSPAALSEAETRLLVEQIVASQLAQQNEALNTWRAEQTEALRALGTRLEELRSDAAAGYQMTQKRIDEIQYPRAVQASLTALGR